MRINAKNEHKVCDRTTPVAISILVRNPDAAERGKIHFHDIGDYLSEKEKLSIIRSFKSIDGIGQRKGWKNIQPDENNDWLNQTDRSFNKYIQIGDKKDKSAVTLFANYSGGLKTQRDAWCYNHSKLALSGNMGRMIDFYNSEMERLSGLNVAGVKQNANFEARKISWSDALFTGVKNQKHFQFQSENIISSTYRPFEKSYLYYSKDFNERRYQMPRIFPDAKAENLSICVTGVGANEHSVLMVNVIPDLNMLAAGGQCFPLKLYEPASEENTLFAKGEAGYTAKDGITDEGLKHYRDAYPDEAITKEDLFYYIYGLLHSPDYRERFKNNLSKQLPRIPAVKQAADFWAFSKAGRALGNLHVNYESVEPYQVTIAEGALELAHIEKPESYFRVEKMKFGCKGKNKDKTIVQYNPRITMTGIPLRAYDYVVNGKPALEWVMERQCVKTDKASGIVNDANDYANETVGNPAYPLELFQRVITVSLKTLDIVEALPKLDID